MKARILKVIDLAVVVTMVGFAFLAGASYTAQTTEPVPSAQPASYETDNTGTTKEGFTVWKG